MANLDGDMGGTIAVAAGARPLVELIESDDLLVGLIRNNPLAIAVTDTARRVWLCNGAFETLFGYQPEEWRGAVIETLLGGGDSTAQIQAFGDAVMRGHCARAATRRCRKNGTVVEVDLTLVPLTLNGAAVGAYGIYRDLTAEREAQRQIEQVLQMKSDFVSFVTHQLRTPLAGIKWMLELAADAQGRDEVDSYVSDARESADRLIALVNDLLDVSRLENGRLQLVLEPLDVRAITAAVLDDVAMLVRERRHLLTVDGDAALPPIIADAQLLRQVVMNLVSNAIKYTPPGGQITVRIATAEDGVQWSITDSGIGIPASAQARLFQKFYRADNALAIDTEGTGLGLYLVRLIIERFGGSISCESQEGHGTTFRFVVPTNSMGSEPR